MSSSDTGVVEEVTVQLAGLEITLTARRVTSATSNPRISVSAATSPAAAEPGTGPEGYHNPYQVSRQLEDRALRAETARDCAALPLPFLNIPEW